MGILLSFAPTLLIRYIVWILGVVCMLTTQSIEYADRAKVLVHGYWTVRVRGGCVAYLLFTYGYLFLSILNRAAILSVRFLIFFFDSFLWP